MNFHILGVGSVGTLLAFHLRRSLRRLNSTTNPDALSAFPNPHLHPLLPSPASTHITLHLRSRESDLLRRRSLLPGSIGGASGLAPDAGQSGQTTVSVEKDGVVQREQGFFLEARTPDDELALPTTPARPASAPLDTPPGLLSRRGYGKGAIDSIIVSTKANSVLSSLRPLLPYITPHTTIVLATNGALGVLQLLTTRLFRDVRNRPMFLLLNNTHGTWTKRRRHTVHAASGAMQVGLVPDEAKMDGMTMEEWESFVASTPPEEANPPTATRSEGVADSLGPRSPASVQTLQHTIASLAVLPLEVTWLPWPDMAQAQRRKLVVNACINPLTALLDVRNGELFGRRDVDAIIRKVCAEAEHVFEWEASGSAGESTDPSGVAAGGRSALPPSLRTAALYAEVQRVIQATGPNWSSMHQDLHPRGSPPPGTLRSEIDFLNGYFSDLSRSFGIGTPANDLLTSLVRAKASMPLRNSRGLSRM